MKSCFLLVSTVRMECACVCITLYVRAPRSGWAFFENVWNDFLLGVHVFDVVCWEWQRKGEREREQKMKILSSIFRCEVQIMTKECCNSSNSSEDALNFYSPPDLVLLLGFSLHFMPYSTAFIFHFAPFLFDESKKSIFRFSAFHEHEDNANEWRCLWFDEEYGVRFRCVFFVIHATFYVALITCIVFVFHLLSSFHGNRLSSSKHTFQVQSNVRFAVLALSFVHHLPHYVCLYFFSFDISLK